MSSSARYSVRNGTRKANGLMMLKHSNSSLAAVLCLALLAAACGSDDSTPTAPTPAVTLTGTWAGMFNGALIQGDGQAELTQTGTNVTGEWSAPMPQPLILLGAPDIDLFGPAEGTVNGTSATITMRFNEAFVSYFGSADCGLEAEVTFNETTLEGSWMNNEHCQPPAVDSGTLSFTRQ